MCIQVFRKINSAPNHRDISPTSLTVCVCMVCVAYREVRGLLGVSFFLLLWDLGLNSGHQVSVAKCLYL